MKSPKTALIALLVLSASFPFSAKAYIVYLHTGHGPVHVNEMWDKSKFPTVSERPEQHGVWAFGLAFQPLDPDQREKLVENVGDKRPTVFESGPYMMKDKPVEWMEKGDPPPSFQFYWDRGFENPTFLMFYREHSTNPGVETFIRPEDVQGLKESIKAVDDRKHKRALQKAKWLTLMRNWTPDLKKSIALEEVGGVVAEFGIPLGGPGHIKNTVAPAIEYTLSKDKYFFLLTPPRNNADSSVKNYYSDGYNAMVEQLEQELSKKSFKSEKLVFVPANYAYGKDGKNVTVTPESDPNTVTGVNKWLIEKAE